MNATYFIFIIKMMYACMLTILYRNTQFHNSHISKANHLFQQKELITIRTFRLLLLSFNITLLGTCFLLHAVL